MMNEIIKIVNPCDENEEYTIYRVDDDHCHWYLKKGNGEGMGYSNKDMFEMLDNFFKTKF